MPSAFPGIIKFYDNNLEILFDFSMLSRFESTLILIILALHFSLIRLNLIFYFID